MGFNHCYLPTIENLQKEFDNVGLEKFVKSYSKYDALSGSNESVYFLETKIKEYEKDNINISYNSSTDKL